MSKKKVVCKLCNADLKKRYPEESCGFKLLNKASYLDPRFHLLMHLTAGQKQEVGLTLACFYSNFFFRMHFMSPVITVNC